MTYQEIKQSLKDRELDEFDMKMAGVMAANIAIEPLMREAQRDDASILAKMALARCVAVVLKHHAISETWGSTYTPDEQMVKAKAMCADCMEQEWPFRLL